MISLEISSTALSNGVLSPRFVRQIDWIDCYWSQERRARADYPKVQKYVLAGMGGSYTDFHVDFGGTSVWYHVIKGCKVFYLIPPTTSNLRAYASWINSANQDTTFFPETLSRLGECKKVSITSGDTLMIPGGWIHAVYTPEDSLVIGGNFLLSPSIIPQLQVYNVEHRTKVSQKYRFPFFRQMVWYVLCHHLPLEMKRQGKLDINTTIPQSSDFEVDSSDDEEEEDCFDESPLIHARVTWAWPYLVKMTEVWLTEGLPADDLKVYEENAKLCLRKIGKTTPENNSEAIKCIVEMWWDLLSSVPTTSAADVANHDVDAKHTYTDYDKHLLKITSLENSSKIFDVLNDDLFEYFPYVNTASCFYHDIVGPDKSLKAEDNVNDTALKLENNDEVESIESSTKLSIKLNRGTVQNSQELESTTVSTVLSNSGPSKLTFKLKPESESSLKNKWVSATETTVTNDRSVAARTYGTRGKRLSAEFLQRAADVDVIGVDNIISQNNSKQLDNGLEESSNKRFKASKDLSHYSDSDDNMSEAEEYEDIIPKPNEGNKGIALKGKRSAAKKKPTTTSSKTVRVRSASSQLKDRLKKKFSR